MDGLDAVAEVALRECRNCVCGIEAQDHHVLEICKPRLDYYSRMFLDAFSHLTDEDSKQKVLEISEAIHQLRYDSMSCLTFILDL